MPVEGTNDLHLKVVEDETPRVGDLRSVSSSSSSSSSSFLPSPSVEEKEVDVPRKEAQPKLENRSWLNFLPGARDLEHKKLSADRTQMVATEWEDMGDAPVVIKHHAVNVTEDEAKPLSSPDCAMEDCSAPPAQQSPGFIIGEETRPLNYAAPTKTDDAPVVSMPFIPKPPGHDILKEEAPGCGCFSKLGFVQLWNTSTRVILDPSLYFRASGEVLVIMLIISWIVTLSLHADYVGDNVLRDAIGYNNICVAFDVIPANYVSAILYGGFLYLSVRFAWTDISRLVQEHRDHQKIRPSAFWYSYIADLMYIGSASAFVLVFVINPQFDLWGHFLAFLQIVIVRWLVILSYMVRQLPPSYAQWWFFGFYTILTFGFFICMILDLAYPPQVHGGAPFVPFQVSAMFDYLWFASLMFTSYMLPPQPRLIANITLEPYKAPIKRPAVPEKSIDDIIGEPMAKIVGKWIDGDIPEFDTLGCEHDWNWETLNTWLNFTMRLTKSMCFLGFCNFGENQYANPCVNYTTLFIFWVWLVVFDCIVLPFVALGFVAWLFILLFYGATRTLEIWGCLAVRLSSVYCVTLTGARNPELECQDIWVARPVPRELELDFWFYRVPGYMLNIFFSYPSAFARLLSGRARPPIVSDDMLGKVSLGSWVAHLLIPVDPNDHTKGYFLDCHVLGHIVNFDGSYMNAERVDFDGQGHVLSITIRDGGVFKPGDKEWELAKAHLQGSMIGIGLAWAHNWQHFVFPDVAGSAQQRLNRNGVLYKLLAPHLRFTIRINQVRDHGSAIENKDNFWHYILVYILLPMTSSEFLVHNSVKTNAFYYPTSPINETGRKAELVNYERMLSQFRIPPFDGVTAAKDAYHYMIYAYYRVIRRFVAKVWPAIDPDDWKQWLSLTVPVIPVLAYANPIDVLATLIWTVSVVHSGDHASLGEGRAYWISSVQKTWNPADSANPRSVFSRWSYCRTQSFFDVYGTRWTNPLLPLYLSQTRHDFAQTHLMEADEELRNELAACDVDLHKQGCAVLPLKALIECLCF